MNKNGKQKMLNIFLAFFPSSRKGKQKSGIFWPFFPGKKGMEMWKLVSIILVLVLLLFVIAWFSGLNEGLGGLFDRLGGLL